MKDELNAETLRGLLPSDNVLAPDCMGQHDWDWLQRQLACWPTRVDKNCTTNVRFLMGSAAICVNYLLDENASLCAELLEQAKANGAGAEREAKLMAERDAAIRECTKWAQEAGEAKGRLEGSEIAGIVDGWREKCEALERRCERLREALIAIRHYRREPFDPDSQMVEKMRCMASLVLEGDER